jgi:hypothetical protein
MPAARQLLLGRQFRAGVTLITAAWALLASALGEGPGPADRAVPTIADAVASRQTKPSVHADQSEIERALAVADVPREMIARLFAAIGEATLPGMAANLDAFLWLTHDPEWLALRRHFAEFLELPGVTELNADRVAAFAGYDGMVTLPDVTVLTPRTAAALAAFGQESWGAGVELPGVGEIAPDAAAALAKCTALLSLPNLRVLSAASARALSAHEGIGLAIGGLATLPADVAAALAQTKSIQGLLLPDLELLDSEPLARRLAGQDHVFLPRVTGLPVTVARALRGNEGGELALPGLAAVTPDLAREFVGGGYYWLTLGGADRLSPEAAAVLALHKGPLTFTGTLPFPAAAAAKLAANEGLISLPHLATPPEEVLLSLSEHRGSLVLGGVKRLTAELAAALASHAGVVFLPAVQTVPPEVAAVLAPRSDTVVLSGLASIDVETAAAFCRHARETLVLGGLTGLSPEVAATLAAFDGPLALPAVTTLEPEVARALATHRGRLVLESITDLPDEVAAELGKHAGGLDLPGVERLSTGAAEALTAAPGTLSLPSLVGLTPEGAAAFLAREEPPELHALQLVERIDSLPLARLLVARFDDLELANVTALEGPLATAIAGVLARTRGTLALPALERISPRALEALLDKKDVVLPEIEGLTLTREPGAALTDDVVVPGP